MSLNDAAKKLQRDLGSIDYRQELFNAPVFDDEGREHIIKVLIQKSGALKLKIYPENGPHKRPHLHVDYGNKRHYASYAIDTGERIAGDALTRDHNIVVTRWIQSHSRELRVVWDQLIAGGTAENLIADLPALDG